MSQFATPAATPVPITKQSVVKVGHVYRSRYPRLTITGEVNDREVTYVGHSVVQFASPMDGGNCLHVTRAEFLDWAGHDVTALYEGREAWHRTEDLQAWRERQNGYGQAA